MTDGIDAPAKVAGAWGQAITAVVLVAALGAGLGASYDRLPVAASAALLGDGARQRTALDGTVPDDAVPDDAVPDDAVPDGMVPDDAVLLRIAETVLPTIPGWTADA